MLLKSTLALAAAGLVGAFASIASAAEPRAVAIEDLTLVAEDTDDAPGAEPDQYHHGGDHHGGYHHGHHHGGYHHGEYHHGEYHHGHHGGYHHGHHGGYHHGGYHHGYHHGGYHHGGYHHGHHGGYIYGGYIYGYIWGGYPHYYNNQTPPIDIESVPAPKVDTEG